MGTVVLYVLLTLLVGAALFAIGAYLFGRGEDLPPVAQGRTLTRLPEGPLTGRDLRGLTFGMAPRGYTMAEVDWALEQAATEIDRLRAQVDGSGAPRKGAERRSSVPGDSR